MHRSVLENNKNDCTKMRENERKGIQIGTKGIENRYRALMKYENEYQNGMEDKNMSMT